MVYFIVTTYFDESTDRKAYQDYIRMVKPIVQKYHGRYIMRSEKVTPFGTDVYVNRKFGQPLIEN